MFLILNFLCRRRKRSPQPVKRRHSSPSSEKVKKARKCPQTCTKKKPKASSKSKEYSSDESDLDVDVDSDTPSESPSAYSPSEEIDSYYDDEKLIQDSPK